MNFWSVSGIIAWSLLGLLVLLRLIFGKNWWLKISTRTVVGHGLIKAIDKLIQEVQDQRVKRETVAEVGAHVVWRVTRIGAFALILALVPFILLFQQNRLISKQNKLFEFQNKRVDKQTTLDSMQTLLLASQNIKIDTQNSFFSAQNRLFTEQNKKVVEQTDLLGEQTVLSQEQNRLVRFQNERIDTQLALMGAQNNLLTGQNTRIDTQNYRINIQNNLLEADRRSSLVFLMSNILDRVDEEIKAQRQVDIAAARLDSTGHCLSEPLIGRIVALSRAFRPYKILEGDTLAGKLVSPERGQLFISLMESKLDSLTQNTIVKNGDFSYATIREIDLPGDLFVKNSGFLYRPFDEIELSRCAFFANGKFRRADLRGVDFRGADLYRAFLSGANLNGAILSGADLRGARFGGARLDGATIIRADLSRADLSRADLSGADLNGSKNLTVQQLKRVKSLYKCKNLYPKLRAGLEEAGFGCLFTEEGCPKD